VIYNLWAASMLPRLGTVRRMRGVFDSWEEARKRSAGYEDPNIASACLNAARQVRDGKAIWERDSVLMPRFQYSWPVVAELLRVRVALGHLSVLDFGGGFGSSYHQFKSFAGSVSSLNWIVAEQEHIATNGASEFSTDELRFTTGLTNIRNQAIDVVLLSSVLQYLPDATNVLKSLQSLGARSIVIDRTPIGSRSFYSVQHVPSSIYRAAYPIHVFSRDELDKLFKRWTMICEFPSYCDQPKRLFLGRIYRLSP
jgi:putative methyltransferase (TIGR04325 family)